jgi:hypothetical protein
MFGLLRLRYLFLLVPRTYQYLINSSVPFYYKWLPFIGLLFFFTPIARILTPIPVLGMVDELTLSLMGMGIFNWLSRRKLQEKLKTEKTDYPEPTQTIEGEFEVIQVKTHHIGKKEVKAQAKLVA